MLAEAEYVSGRAFDYVVIGGGTAGLAIAVRLSEDPAVSVLVLEAGDAHIGDSVIVSPAALATQMGKEEYDWDYTTTPQASLGGRVIKWPRGKILGGTSAINYFFYHRPCKADVDAFEKLGNKGWNWALLEPYFKKVERFIPPSRPIEGATYDMEQRGTDGPITITYTETLTGFEEPYHQSLAAMGIRRAAEPFSGDIKGTWFSPMSVNHSTRSRSYATNGYYEPNANRPNLYLLPSAQVAKIETVGEDGLLRATAVVFVHKGKTGSARVGREAILSAGVLGNPQILELSGIGNKDILTAAGIDVRVQLDGVGNNVQDRVGIRAVFELKDDPGNKFLTTDRLRDPESLQKQLEIYNESGTGVFATSTNLVTFEPLASMSLSYETLQRDLTASVQQGAVRGKYPPAVAKQHAIQLENIKRREPSCEQVLINGVHLRHPEKMPLPGKKYVSMVAMLSHPFSRGSVHISSSDPSSPLAIDANYFDEPYDIYTLVEILKFSRRLMQQEPFKEILSGVELFPGSENDTDEKLADCVRQYAETFFHTVGSCAMLPREDGGVVDTKLKVYGTANIRVVDISAIPLHVAGHTQSVAYAIAELGTPTKPEHDPISKICIYTGADIIRGSIDI